MELPVQTVDLEGDLLLFFKIVRTLDFGDCLLIEMVGTIDLGGCLLIEMVETFDSCTDEVARRRGRCRHKDGTGGMETKRERRETTVTPRRKSEEGEKHQAVTVSHG